MDHNISPISVFIETRCTIAPLTSQWNPIVNIYAISVSSFELRPLLLALSLHPSRSVALIHKYLS